MIGEAVTAVRGARGVDGGALDLRIERGTVVEAAPASARPVAAGELDAAGMLVLPPGVEPHAHLDKALVVDDVGPVYGGLLEGIAAWQRHAPTLDEDDFVRRGLALARRYLANGVTAVRTHAEIFPTADPLRSVRALARVRELLGDVLDLQIAVLPKNDIADETVHAALDAGADLVGGSPHTAADPAAELDRLVGIARARGVGIDIHADERLDPASLTAVRLARAIAAAPLAGTATASHCVSLGLLAAAELAEAASALHAAGVAVVACPATNLYLQGRDRPVATPRGITAVRGLLERGVEVAGGGDNVRDTINPLGDADHLTTAALLVMTAHLTIEEAYAAVTDAGRRVMGLPPAGPVAGAVADLVLVDAPSLAAAVAGGARSRTVVRGGRVVSVRRVDERLAGPR